jgi:O-antigen ligase
MSRQRAISLILISLLSVFVLLGVLGVTSSTLDFSTTEPNNPLLARLSSIFTPDTTLDTGSLQWRVFENEHATQSIAANPVTGVGLGNNYRGATLMRQRETVGDLRFARFIHNSYLYMAVKMGLPGSLIFLWVCAAFLVGGWHIYRSVQHVYWKPITLAMLASFAGLLFWSNTQPNFMLVEGTLFVGVMIGIVEVCRQLASNEAGGQPA